MQYQFFSPPALLQPFIRYIWVLENDAVDAASITFSPLADGCPGILFQQPDKGLYYDAAYQQMPGLSLYGQTIEPMKLHATGKLSTIGICFHPDALKTVFGMNAHELTGSCVDLNLLPNKKEKYLQDRLFHAGTIREQVDILSSYLSSFIQNKNNQPDLVTRYAVTEIGKVKSPVSLKDLQQKLQLSERSFERKFKQAVGITPKLFSRICRFQEALTQLRNNQYRKLSDIAYENGYADQSHFIRSFKEFTGISPFDYRKQVSEIAENFPRLIQ